MYLKRKSVNSMYGRCGAQFVALAAATRKSRSSVMASMNVESGLKIVVNVLLPEDGVLVGMWASCTEVEDC